ncbi:MAG: hypothetical protein LUE92_13675 [Clostridiales bacterium]|nr:hypothetical protein [Clostridiales bacterium]
MDIVLLIVFLLFYTMAVLFFIGWIVGYPIYKKIRKEPVFEDARYALGLAVPSLIVALCNVAIQILLYFD